MLIPQPAFAPSGPDHPCVNRAEFRAEARKVMHEPALQHTGKLRRLLRCANAPKAARHYLDRWRAWRRRHGVLLAARREWQGYRAAPMDWCTWAEESGLPSPSNPEWSGPRYRQPNLAGSSASGKFQIIDGTWRANGGTTTRALYATKVEQERVARNVLGSQGLGAWVNCP